MSILHFRKCFERRKEARIPYSGCILFTADRRFYEAVLKDFSRHGLFIRTPEPFPIGQIITVALPYSENKNDKRKARIVWCNHEGFGVKFITKLNGKKIKLYIKNGADWKSFP